MIPYAGADRRVRQFKDDCGNPADEQRDRILEYSPRYGIRRQQCCFAHGTGEINFLALVSHQRCTCGGVQLILQARGEPDDREHERSILPEDRVLLERKAAMDYEATNRVGTPLEVLRAFLKLGLISFGGPIAHIGYFRQEFVVRRRWISDAAYTDIVALCQFL